MLQFVISDVNIIIVVPHLEGLMKLLIQLQLIRDVDT